MDKLKAVVLWLIEFVVTYTVEVACFALGWNVFLCMAWESLPVLTFTQVALTVLGLKFCKFAFSKWYNGTKKE